MVQHILVDYSSGYSVYINYRSGGGYKMINPRVKTVSSTSNVDFRNTSNGYYDMIIMVQNTLVSQSINITDTEGNSITEEPIVLNNSAKIILKDIKIGSISFSDTNSYNIIISYTVKTELSGIPYIDIDYSTGNIEVSGTTTKLSTYQNTFTALSITENPVPPGKLWKIKSIAMQFVASATATYKFKIANIPPTNITNSNFAAYSIFDVSVDVTEGDIYSILLSEYATTQASTEDSSIYLSSQRLYHALYIDTTYLGLFLQSDEPTNTTYYTIEYEEVNII